MKISGAHIVVLLFVVLASILLKTISFWTIGIVLAVFALEQFRHITRSQANALYVVGATAMILPIFWLVLLFLPFTVFGALLSTRNFIRDYMIGFGVSFIPTTIIYLLTTYTNLSFSVLQLTLIFYALPAIAVFFLKKRALEVFSLTASNVISSLIVILMVYTVAAPIVDNSTLFMSNGSREFYRSQNAFEGLMDTGKIPLYDPTIGNGEATYLWVPPTNIAHQAVAHAILNTMPPLLFFNALSVFILLITVLSLAYLFSVIVVKQSSIIGLGIGIVAALTGTNFFMLQILESFKAYYTYPLIHLIVALVIVNPKTINEYALIMFIGALLPMIHSAAGVATFMLVAGLFLVTKSYVLTDRTELKQFFTCYKSILPWVGVLLIGLILMPLFYILTPSLFSEFLIKDEKTSVSVHNIVSGFGRHMVDLWQVESTFLSLQNPEPRIDDHKFGPFMTVAGLVSFGILMLLFKNKSLRFYRRLVFGYVLHLLLLGLIYFLAIRFGGFLKTPSLYLITSLGASIIVLISILANKKLQLGAIAICTGFLFLATPLATETLSNIHREAFMGGSIMSQEMEVIRQLPIDGRIMTYGLYSNVIDYGIGYFTDRYASRSERIALNVGRAPYEKIHGQHSFGDLKLLTDKAGIEVTNYLRAGGYKYVFMNIGHPTSQYVLGLIYPNYTYPLYQNRQNNAFVILGVNNTNYAEKVSLVDTYDPSWPTRDDGYYHVTLSDAYGYQTDPSWFGQETQPEPLSFTRPRVEEVHLSGEFEQGDWVQFKEQYFARWKAYMNGQELPVYANHNEMMLVQTLQGSQLTLVYQVLDKERMLATISLVGILIVACLLVLRLRKS